CLSTVLPRFSSSSPGAQRDPHSFPTRRSSDLPKWSGSASSRPGGGVSSASSIIGNRGAGAVSPSTIEFATIAPTAAMTAMAAARSEEHTSELQSRENLVCRLLLEKKKKTKNQE